MGTLALRLSMYMHYPLALFASGMLAFALTLLLSILSYRFIEGPIMNLKRHVKYGSAKPLAPAQEAGERVLVGAGV
jgi:peptidoglycan/LPS O-acetylase OafA/YrhL